MTPQDLIKQIAAIPFDGQVSADARNAFLSQFPLHTIPEMTRDKYRKTGDTSTFCYNLEFVRNLPFGIGGQSNNKFGKDSNPYFPNVQGIADMISDTANGDVHGLRAKHHLEDISVVVLIKILSIYLPDKFITIGQEFTLVLLARILGIEINQTDRDYLIELNYLCTQELIRLNEEFAQYEYNRLGTAIWQILSPANRSGFEAWLKKNKAQNSGAVNAYLTSIDRLSYYYKENYYSKGIQLQDINTLYNNTILHQKENKGRYYYSQPSYGNRRFYSAAVGSYKKFIFGSTQPLPSQVLPQTAVYSKNIILYGPPGTGKTYSTIRYAVAIIKNLDVNVLMKSDTYPDDRGEAISVNHTFNDLKNRGQIIFTTFHQSLSYEDFIEGIKPQSTEKKDNVLYVIQPGILKRLCEKARQHPEDKYVLIIDEINRGNVACIFGELITLIEEDKREGQPNAIQCTLPYSKEPFSIPNNLYILGTMNTADRSVEALDSALRRRFDFIEMLPDTSKVLFRKDIFERINSRLRILKDAEHQLGHSYFMRVTNDTELCAVFHNKVIPLIQEYFWGDMEKIRLVIGNGFCEKESLSEKLFPNNATDIDIPTDIWRLWGEDKWKECESNITLFTDALNKLMKG